MRVPGSASGSHRPELDALTTNRALAMPLLPTLATALLIASLSLLCRQPAPPEPSAETVTTPVAAPTGAAGFPRLAQAAEPAAAVPATIAFGQLYPLSPDAAPVAIAGRPSRVASATRRAPKRTDTVRSAANPPRPQPETAPLPFRDPADEDGYGLPEGALPFAPTAAAVVDSVRALGGEAATLGGSVIGSLALIR